ncbi:RAD51-associated protein 1 isoform X3 [Sciurus carolinensis]|uniref:RAD51-associated protein 1 isoform X3 n=1 Tax=Sciurus carolinensis TaxID=30640 RepID=UPI001FB45A06|nr:RAD51-associated protein 1 isoform X3 [Sciurus carolinensis]
MVRPVRHKKPVNYSQFEDSDSDDDFVSATIPLNKKSRTTSKESKQDKPKPNLQNPKKEDIQLQEKTPKKRMALDDKLFQRGLEVALALSVKELPTVTNDVTKSQDKSIEKHGNSKTEIMNKSHISNCSIASDYLDLNKITEEDDACGVQGKRKAASKAVAQQRKMLLEDSDGDSANDTEPDIATGDSEEDSDFDESDDNDENFTMKKSKVKEIKKKEVKVKSPVEKKEKKSKSKCNTSAASRSGSNSSSPLAGVSVRSPNQSLRLGLSRLARVKPLHPNATSSQVW